MQKRSELPPTKLLTVDIGNTNVAVGLFKGDQLIRRTKFRTALLGKRGAITASLFSGRGSCPPAIVSSVVPEATREVIALLKREGCSDLCVLGKSATVPIANRYSKPRQVGQDRLVNAYAAKSIYGAPSIVIDLGTAVTFDCVSRKGGYLGGAIMPGIRLSLDSLYKGTALLPFVKLKEVREPLGRSTDESIRAGILFGFGSVCDGFITRYRKVLGKKTSVILTGGDARLVSRYCASSIIIDEDLMFKGLYLVYRTLSKACS